MALDAAALRGHLNGVPDTDEVLTGLLGAATAHVEAMLGYEIDDAIEFPAGTPADIEHAVLMLAAHWYENREASIAGVAIMAIPFGLEDIIRNHRSYTYG
ncbi:phage gp6-like head-tail connector protein [Jiella endophytica]|uniref:Phage gp6-like head-tail connector protein n=1 Tax=Jiella endophytica TaxID=2558362 RepID=A0A4Y8RUN1_9HYPH|nr:head-tail connector protein [Jiella endophytica]TFF27517.1 phage gp6-like head-tail connector protein [Jiella endophytica]